MIQLDEKLLEELGLGQLPPDETQALLEHLYETLETRVGTVLAESFSDQQLEEFEQLMVEGDEAAALAWLQTARPDYQDVVRAQFEALKKEVRADADAIRATIEAG